MPVPNSIGHSVGVELEIPNLTERLAAKIIRSEVDLAGWRVVHDGSVQRRGRVITGTSLPVQTLEQTSNQPRLRNDEEDYSPLTTTAMLGSEFVSPILNTAKPGWEKAIYTIFDLLNEGGMELDNYLSFHVHVNARGLPNYVLQNVINLWLRAEASIYRLSIAELGHHRGTERKDFLYCRPLQSPLVIISNRKFRHCYDVDKLLKATTYEELFAAYGSTSIDIDPNKYFPVRYSGLNFYSFINLGTVEFRTFNMTKNAEYALAWIGLCQCILKAAMGKPVLDYELQPLGSKPSDFDLMDLQVMLDIDERLMPALESLWNRSKWIDFDPVPIFTHLPQAAHIAWSREYEDFMPPEIKVPVRVWTNETTYQMCNSIDDLSL